MITQEIKEVILSIDEYLDKIQCLPHAPEEGESLGLTFDEDGVTRRSQTHVSGCGYDTFSVTYSWEELSKPLIYFEKMFKEQKERQDEEARREVINSKRRERDKELKQLKNLKEKYPDGK